MKTQLKFVDVVNKKTCKASLKVRRPEQDAEGRQQPRVYLSRRATFNDPTATQQHPWNRWATRTLPIIVLRVVQQWRSVKRASQATQNRTLISVGQYCIEFRAVKSQHYDSSTYLRQDPTFWWTQQKTSVTRDDETRFDTPSNTADVLH